MSRRTTNELKLAELEMDRLEIELESDFHCRNDLLRARQTALSDARDHFRIRHEDATPEQILSLAAKFEAYLTAPATVLSETEATK